MPLCPQVEKRLELVKQVSHSTHKKLTACLQGQQGVDADKRSVRFARLPWGCRVGSGAVSSFPLARRTRVHAHECVGQRGCIHVNKAPV